MDQRLATQMPVQDASPIASNMVGKEAAAVIVSINAGA
jgi:hypothetical protein